MWYEWKILDFNTGLLTFTTTSSSEWTDILPGKIFGRFTTRLCILLLICINDMTEGITSICKIFVIDASLFAITNKDKLSQSNLNTDLKK